MWQVWLVFPLLTFKLVKIDTSAGCPTAAAQDGFVFNNAINICYRVYRDSTSWVIAMFMCASGGYRLVILNNSLKAAGMTSLIGQSTAYTEDGYWIGLSSDGWVDGTRSTDGNWCSADPGLMSERCARLDRGCSYKWTDDDCGAGRSYICEAV